MKSGQKQQKTEAKGIFLIKKLFLVNSIPIERQKATGVNQSP